MSRALPKYRKRRIALIGGSAAVVLSGAVIAGSALAGQSGPDASEATTKRAAATVNCPDVAAQFAAVPAAAQAAVNRELALLATQIQEANNRLGTSTGQGGANFVQNAILNPLKDKRVATINRIATATGTALAQQQTDTLATCALNNAGNAGGNNTGNNCNNQGGAAQGNGGGNAAGAGGKGNGAAQNNGGMRQGNGAAGRQNNNGHAGNGAAQQSNGGNNAGGAAQNNGGMRQGNGGGAAQQGNNAGGAAQGAGAGAAQQGNGGAQGNNCGNNAGAGNNGNNAGGAAGDNNGDNNNAGNQNGGNNNGGNNAAAVKTVNCPDIASRLRAVPAAAQAAVNRELALLTTQIQEANNRLATSTGQGGANFVQNAILNPLKDKRVATINRIVAAVGGSAGQRQVNALATCTLSK